MTAQQALEAVLAKHEVPFIYGGRCSGGEVGAHFAQSRDGTRLVYKWSDDPHDLGRYLRVLDRVTRLRAKGYMAPRYLPPYVVAGGVVVFQEAVAGQWHDDVDHSLLDILFQLNDLQVGEGDEQGEEWTHFIRRTLLEGADGYCIHETLRRYSDQTRHVLDVVTQIGHGLGTLPDGDAVHFDFHHRNLLRDVQGLTAVIDWEGSLSGDRVFDLVTLLFGMTHANTDYGVEDRIWERAHDLGNPDSLAAYVAHMSLRRLDWTIRHHSDELERLMPVVDRYLGLVG